ncbi:DUF4082 domain-containing protein, partial [Cryobacterium sp. MLB-32]|uniref:DUF4082 domain-containing protein n=1 Tax=Cryobacterium sp. MLB-32 TaxID=1529318 RepID=UPI00055CA50E
MISVTARPQLKTSHSPHATPPWHIKSAIALITACALILIGVTTSSSVAVAATSVSLFGSETPVAAASGDSGAVELGVAFTSSQAGSATGIRFFKGTGNNGTHVGHLWTSGGTQLASVTFTGETATGWQTATLATPIALTAGTTYVVSYFAPQGHYSYTSPYFTSTKTSGPLSASTANGRYFYGASGGFPTSS